MKRYKFLRNSFMNLILVFLVHNSFGLSNGRIHLDQSDPNTLLESEQLLVKSVLPFFLEELLNSQSVANFHRFVELQETQRVVNDQCLHHLTLLSNTIIQIGLNNSYFFDPRAVAAVQMLDSWGKIPEGILSGHVQSLGDFDECVGIRGSSSVDGSTFKGRYCMNYIGPAELPATELEFRKAVAPGEWLSEAQKIMPFLFIPVVSTCLPSSCSDKEMEQVLNFIINNAGLSATVGFCDADDERPELDTPVIIMIVILSILGMLIVTGTALDLNKSLGTHKQKKFLRIFISFSLYTNIRKWADTSTAGGFECMYGIRALGTCWVMWAHTFGWVLSVWNTIDWINMYKRDFTIYFVLNGFFSVDTFFAMSGLLAAYTMLKGLDKKPWDFLSVPMLYLHRFLRLTPTLALYLGVIATLLPYMGSGPLFRMGGIEASRYCKEFMWHNILYIQNFVDYDGDKGEVMCEAQTWYLANDMHFFLVSPIFVFLLHKWRRVGLAALAAATIASILIPGIYTAIEDAPPTLILWKEMPKGASRPWFRISPYLGGMWMGYILYRLGNKRVKLPKWIVLVGWAVSTATALTILLGVRSYYEPEDDGNTVGSAFYAGLSRFVWSIVICWIIFACVKGYGGWVNSFLSWKFFVPLGRLTYCVYLSSLTTQLLYQTTQRQPFYFTMYNIMNVFFAHIITCFFVGFWMSMCFEVPFVNLEKILFEGMTSSDKKSKIKEINVDNVLESNPSEIKQS